MDNVTHTLFALTLARTPLGCGGRGATAALVLASSAPDIDIVATLGGSASYLTWHRGPTHGPLGVVGLGVLTAVLVWLGGKTIKSWGPPSASAKASADRRSLGEGWSGGPIRLKPDPTMRRSSRWLPAKPAAPVISVTRDIGSHQPRSSQRSQRKQSSARSAASALRRRSGHPERRRGMQ